MPSQLNGFVLLLPLERFEDVALLVFPRATREMDQFFSRSESSISICSRIPNYMILKAVFFLKSHIIHFTRIFFMKDGRYGS